MPRFFVDDVLGNTTHISGDDAKHIAKSLRMKVGDTITLCDRNSIEYDCEITEIDAAIKLNVLSSKPCEREPKTKITLFQAMPKSDKMDFIVQKAVELGVDTIYPIITSRCISRPDPKKQVSKIARYNKVAIEAAKQCGRGKIPRVADFISYNDCLDLTENFDTSLLFYELGGEQINSLISEDEKDIAIIIGSEGGFSETEVSDAIKKGIKVASLGKIILRCETAPIVALSILMNITKNI